MNPPLKCDTDFERAAREFVTFTDYATAEALAENYVTFERAAEVVGLTQDGLLDRLRTRIVYLDAYVVVPSVRGADGWMVPTGEPAALRFTKREVRHVRNLEAAAGGEN